MKRATKHMNGMHDGLALALRIVRQGGVEALEKEIKFRGVTGINTAVAMKELNEALGQIKEHTTTTVISLALDSLHDVYGFGAIRGARFLETFEGKASDVMNDMYTWTDVIDRVNKTYKIEMGLWEEEE